MDPVYRGAVLVRPEGLFFATDHALFHAERFDGELVRVEGVAVPLDARIDSLVAASGSIFVGIAGRESRVLESPDEGVTWIDRTPEVEVWRSTLLSNGERLVMGGVDPREFLEFDGSEWKSVTPAAPEGEGDHIGFDPIAFDGDALVANDIYGGGLVRLPPEAARFERLEGLGEWGYTSFVSRPDVRVTVNDSAIFAEVAGEWSATHAFEAHPGEMEILDLGTHLLALGNRQMTSVDGITWTDQGAPMQLGGVSASGFESRVAWLVDGQLKLSDDGGESWAAPQLAVDHITDVSLTADGLHARGRLWQRLDTESWTEADTNVAVGGFTEDGLWSCRANTCSFTPSDGSPVETFSVPQIPNRVFATDMGVFLGGDLREGLYCEDAPPTLSRLDPATGVITPMTGLPSVTCGNRLMRGNLVQVGAELLLSVQEALDTTTTFRSEDGGETWIETSAPDETISAAVDVESGRHALFGGTIARYVDGAYEPIETELEEITDLVALDGRLMVSTYATRGPSVWASLDAREWFPAAELGPILALDARDGVLAVATSTTGAWSLRDCY